MGGNWAHAGPQAGYAVTMIDPTQRDPARDCAEAPREDQVQVPPQEIQPHEQPPPDNPPVDEHDLERGRANLERVIPK